MYTVKALLSPGGVLIETGAYNLVSTTSVEVRTMQNRKSNVIHRSNQILSNEMWINRFPSILFHNFSRKVHIAHSSILKYTQT